MVYTKEIENMCCVAKGPNHGPAPIPEEGKWIQAKEIKDISGMTHGVGWCAHNRELANSHSTSRKALFRSASLKPSDAQE